VSERELQAENEKLRQQLRSQQQEINQLLQWTQSLQRDIDDVYRSVTWNIGDFIAKIILKLLRRPPSPTARDHIERLNLNLARWKQHYFRNLPETVYFPAHDTQEYHAWLQQYFVITDKDVLRIQQEMLGWKQHPKISVLLPLPLEINEVYLQQALDSLARQIYAEWEVLLIGKTEVKIGETAQIRKITTDSAKRAEQLNLALQHATGDWIVCFEAADQFAPRALYRLAKTIQANENCKLIYSDHDYLDATGTRYDPYFKSDWNPDLFHAQNYLRFFTAYSREFIVKLGGFQDYPDNEEYDLSLRCLENMQATEPLHLAEVLYHHRNTEPVPILNSQTACAALTAHFKRQQQTVQISATVGGHTRIHYALPEVLPLVSLIIPTRDKLSLLEQTVEGLLHKTDYPNIELIIMDNGSVETVTLAYFKNLVQQDARVRVIRHDAPFNYSELNNLGIAQSRGEIIGLINNDLAVIHGAWLSEMVSHALRPEIGAVGAKLFYPNETLQHAGVIVGLGGMAGHGFKHLPKAFAGDHWRPHLTQNYTAVTGACLLMRREIFEEVGGLNAKDLKVAFNDVDLCLKIRQHGYRIVWTPHAQLYHFESISRGSDNTPRKYLRLRHELNYMADTWGKKLARDPYYNPNLTLQYEDFSLAYPPRGLE
jgi:GT2 family glycosyltransferase